MSPLHRIALSAALAEVGGRHDRLNRRSADRQAAAGQAGRRRGQAGARRCRQSGQRQVAIEDRVRRRGAGDRSESQRQHRQEASGAAEAARYAARRQQRLLPAASRPPRGDDRLQRGGRRYRLPPDARRRLSCHDPRRNRQDTRSGDAESCPEFVDPKSKFAAQIKAARDRFSAKFKPETTSQPVTGHARITGVGFFGRTYGSRKAEGNLIQLHPVLNIEWLDKPTAEFTAPTEPPPAAATPPKTGDGKAPGAKSAKKSTTPKP